MIVVGAVAFGLTLRYFNISILQVAQMIVSELRAVGPWYFFAAMAVLPAIGAPLLPFALAAGPAFAPRLGTLSVVLLAVASVAVNTALSYLIARFLLTRPVTRAVHWLGYSLPKVDSRSGWKAVLALRLAPGLPFWVQSYVLGVAGIAWTPYIVVSTLVPAFYLTGAIVAGEAAWRGGVGAAMFGVSLIVFAGMVTYLWRTRRAAHET